VLTEEEIRVYRHHKTTRAAFTLSLAKVKEAIALERDVELDEHSDEQMQEEYNDRDNRKNECRDGQACEKKPRKPKTLSAESLERRITLKETNKRLRAEEKEAQKQLRVERIEAAKKLVAHHEESMVAYMQNLPAPKWLNHHLTFECVYTDLPAPLREYLHPRMSELRNNNKEPPEYKFVYLMLNGKYNIQFTSPGSAKPNDVQLGVFQCPRIGALAVAASKIDARLRKKTSTRSWLAWMRAYGNEAALHWIRQVENMKESIASSVKKMEAATSQEMQAHHDEVEEAAHMHASRQIEEQGRSSAFDEVVDETIASTQRASIESPFKMYSESEITEILNCKRAAPNSIVLSDALLDASMPLPNPAKFRAFQF